MNTFRLPIGWQYVTPALGGGFDPSEWAEYDKLVQSCLAVNAYCIIDIHNYGISSASFELLRTSPLMTSNTLARWNGQVIGQSGGAVTDGDFASLWQQIAAYYAGEPRVIFGVRTSSFVLVAVYELTRV